MKRPRRRHNPKSGSGGEDFFANLIIGVVVGVGAEILAIKIANQVYASANPPQTGLQIVQAGTTAPNPTTPVLSKVLPWVVPPLSGLLLLGWPGLIGASVGASTILLLGTAFSD